MCYRGRRLVVEKDEEEVLSVPAVHVDQVLIFGNVTVTTPALSFLLDRGISTVFLTTEGRYKGRLEGPTGGNGPLRLLQYQRVSDSAWALEVARAMVAAKLHNMRALLRRYARRAETGQSTDGETLPGPEEAVSPPGKPAPAPDRAEEESLPPVPGEGERLEKLRAAADDLTVLIDHLGRCRSLLSLNGMEGRGTAVYFSVFRHLIRRPGWTFTGRVRRPPGDPVNVLLSLGYTVLAHNVESAVRTVGLDPYLGFLHQVEYNRPSLALDLMEPFRPIVVDSVVLRCINNGIVLPEHFAADPKGPYPVRLVDEGRSRFIRELEGRLNLTFTDPESGERVTYRRLLELQARQIARALQTGERFRPFRVR